METHVFIEDVWKNIIHYETAEGDNGLVIKRDRLYYRDMTPYNGGPIKIERAGAIYNFKDSVLHCEDGPAVVMKKYCDFVSLKWYKDGALHRDDDGPAMEVFWYRDNLLKDSLSSKGEWYRDRDFLEANFLPGIKEWYRDGKLDRDSGPAVICENYKMWCKNGKIHRECGPAKEYSDGTLEWYCNGRLHRDIEPAIVSKGYLAWYKHGKCIGSEYLL
jgi:hypothetical protein